jgi:hypothetical protein
MRLELTIDDLVLDGVDPRDRARIADAVQRELAGLRWPGSSRRVREPADREPGGREGPSDAIARAVRRSIAAAMSERVVR